MSEGSKREFVHLHVHSEYSLLDGAARIEELVKSAANQGMKALALTDHGVMYGAIPFYKSCVKYGIKPIIGCEVYFTSGSRFEKGNRKENPTYHLILLAKNETGYQNLMRIVSLAHLEGFHYKPRIDIELLREYHNGIICLSACLGGEINQHLLSDRYEEAKEAALRYFDIFGEDFYLELQDHGLIDQKRAIQEMIKLAEELNLPLVVTNDVHYIEPKDAAVQEVLICIGTGKSLQDEDRMVIGTDQLYLKSEEEMIAHFSYVPKAIANTSVIADKCDLQLTFGRVQLPQFWPIPQGESSTSFLYTLCQEGLIARYGGLEQWVQQSEFRKSAQGRLQYELSVIERMGYSDYFLIVWDFVRFAKERHIAVGPGRGSSAGSLVAYTLNITDVDPLKYNLLFERFLNPERITMPDIDIDFDDERRDEVIHYVAAKYGEEHVAQIITFGTMAAKAAIRDVGRAMNISFQETDRAARHIPNQVGMTIEEAIKVNPELKHVYDQSSSTKQLIDMAIKVEGMPRHSSTHAAGVVISGQPLTHYTPLQSGSEQMALTQYSMEHLEALGLLKMDFLGLRTLSIIDRTLRWIEQRHGVAIDFHEISDQDSKTYEMLGLGETTGIFQLESAGVRKVLKEMKPTNFEDIVSVLALYRPGPMEFIPKYIDGKHGKIAVEYPHPSLEPIMRDTFGIIVYQEQIMQIASKMAGFSLGEADLLRRAVSKKKRDVLDQERTHFVNGSLKMGYEEQVAQEVYDMIVRFADYGFPRAHAVAYGVLAYQTAWLKAHYPIVFMASMLVSVSGNMRKTAEYVDECRKMSITILPPDVNESGAYFTPMQDSIRFGLSAIKNVGTQAIDAIIVGRKSKPYENLVDFCRRVDLRVVNKRVIESLILAGAFDNLPGHRAQLLAIVDDAIETVTKWKKQRDELQIELFGFEEMLNWDVELPNIRPYLLHELLEHEYELLGMYLSGHPLDAVVHLQEEMKLDRLIQVGDQLERSKIVAAVRISQLKPYTTKSGQPMAFLEVDDEVISMEAVIFSSVWKKHHGKLEKDQLAVILATIQKQDEDFKLLIDDITVIQDGKEPHLKATIAKWQQLANRTDHQKTFSPQLQVGKKEASLSNAKEKTNFSVRRAYIKISSTNERSSTLTQLKKLLMKHHGSITVVLFYEQQGKSIELSETYSIMPSEHLVKDVERLLGSGTIIYK